ncbi:DDE-type integrase/transposase/recombinase [Ktedonobacter racemifer]|uniref:Integrase catalytic region n=1 Tax=Ktedonobacter racemifer DSM 44963 TaxID=485913 RepID=D6TW94_KTERA|nr:DDE-type integrase/transposase/recombinase [Ktedonobacter racemifer]EFH84477.1 Integrase catalytic region [Ktedonobacter racemifer DSM 44963]
MPTEDEMTVSERRKYLKRMKPLYIKAERTEQSRMLTEMEQVTGLHRKSLLRLLHAPTLERKKREKGRGRTDGLAVEQVILVVWESLDYVCAERLTPVLLSTAEHLARFRSVRLTSEVRERLAQISEATVTRILYKYRSRKQRLPQKGPERANQVRKPVPMKRIPWETSETGHFEVDLVQHSGESGEGIFAFTLQMVDVATGWSERVAILGKGQQAMEGGFRHILQRLPFAVKELHPDNGSEFFNHHLVRFWGEAITGLMLSRSRPYQKNDNRFVEQKNATLVRQYFGAIRLDTPEQVQAMNALYEHMWIYYNFFQPVLHLKEKVCQADKVVRHWDQAQTPYQRLIAAGGQSLDQRTRLQALYEQTNPMALRKEIYRLLDALWDTPCATASIA